MQTFKTQLHWTDTEDNVTSISIGEVEDGYLTGYGTKLGINTDDKQYFMMGNFCSGYEDGYIVKNSTDYDSIGIYHIEQGKWVEGVGLQSCENSIVISNSTNSKWGNMSFWIWEGEGNYGNWLYEYKYKGDVVRQVWYYKKSNKILQVRKINGKTVYERPINLDDLEFSLSFTPFHYDIDFSLDHDDYDKSDWNIHKRGGGPLVRTDSELGTIFMGQADSNQRLKGLTFVQQQESQFVFFCEYSNSKLHGPCVKVDSKTNNLTYSWYKNGAEQDKIVHYFHDDKSIEILNYRYGDNTYYDCLCIAKNGDVQILTKINGNTKKHQAVDDYIFGKKK